MGRCPGRTFPGLLKDEETFIERENDELPVTQSVRPTSIFMSKVEVDFGLRGKKGEYLTVDNKIVECIRLHQKKKAWWTIVGLYITW